VVLAICVFWTVSLVFWADPIERTQALVQSRSQTVAGQTADEPNALLTWQSRLRQVLDTPLDFSTYYDQKDGDYATYESHPSYGFLLFPRRARHVVLLLGTSLALLFTCAPLLAKLRFFSRLSLLEPQADQRYIWLMGIICVLASHALFLFLFNTLPWVRYYLPLTPFYLLLIGVGLSGLFTALELIYPQIKRLRLKVSALGA
jgi:hypothetical protein